MNPLPANVLSDRKTTNNVKAVAVDNGLGKIPEQVSLVYDYLFSFLCILAVVDM